MLSFAFRHLKQQWDKMTLPPPTEEDHLIAHRLAERDERSRKLMEKGGGTIAEFLLADFGTLRPKGITIRDVPKRYVTIEEYKKSDSYAAGGRWGGVVENGSDNKFYVDAARSADKEKKYAWHPGTSNVVTHELAHTSQNAQTRTGWRGVAEGNIGYEIYPGKFNAIEREIHKRAFAFIATPSCKTKTPILRNILGAIHSNESLDRYYASNNEIQARIGEFIATGYAAWQRLPQNKIELWAALNNIGLVVPASIAEELYTTEKGLTAIRDFRVNEQIRRISAFQAGRINDMQLWLNNADAENLLWKKHLPIMYGNFLEFYGDIRGRSRMTGCGANPRKAIELLRDLKECPEILTEEVIKDRAEKINPAVCRQLVNTLIEQYPPTHRQMEQAVMIVENLLAQEDVNRAVLEPHTVDMDQGPLCWEPPLKKALHANHAPMIRALVHAGANPYHMDDLQGLGQKFKGCVWPLDYIDTMVMIEAKLRGEQPLRPQEEKFYKDASWRRNTRKFMEQYREGLRVLGKEMPDHLYLIKDLERAGVLKIPTLEPVPG